MASALLFALAMVTLMVMGSATQLRGGCESHSTCQDTVANPCCVACELPLKKYFSVDHGWGHPPYCGETCLDPSDFDIYHMFEPNLTDASGVPHPCAHQYAPNGNMYSVYNSTVTHGWPGVLAITLDLYSPA